MKIFESLYTIGIIYYITHTCFNSLIELKLIVYNSITEYHRSYKKHYVYLPIPYTRVVLTKNCTTIE